MKISASCFFVICFWVNIIAQSKTSLFLKNELLSVKDSLFQQVLAHPETYHYQVIYTQINRDKHNQPSFTNYYLNTDASQYFNPASTVKLPLAFLTLEKLKKMNVPGVNKYTSIQFDSGYSKQFLMYKDSTSENGLPSLAHFIKKAFLISDNDAYNRMYEFVGQQTINRNLHAKGYKDIRITRRFVRMTPGENRHTNPIRFLDSSGKLTYQQPPAYNTDSFDFSQVHKMGKAHYNSRDSLVNEPIDFTTHNNLSLKDLQQLLQSVMFPASVPGYQRFELAESDYRLLYQYLSQYPSETNYPKYDTSQYFDSYVKFLFKNGGHAVPSYIRVFNKAGWSYGCMTDVSYVADFKNRVEFMVTATIYVNKDEILNDDKYEYDEVALPFFYTLGQHLYKYELKRKRKFKPDLSRFKMKYEKRIPDGRESIKDADN
jgi:Beta-lactamase enzyme family